MRRAVIICGSRNWANRRAIERVVEDLPDGCVVIHGGARGADRIAGQMARRHRLTEWAMPAPWDSGGRGAGVRRNRAMLAALTSLRDDGYEVAVYAFPLRESRGTRHMMTIAEHAHVCVHNMGCE